MTKPRAQVFIMPELSVSETSVVNRGKGSSRKINLRPRAFALATLILMLSVLLYSEPKNSENPTASVQSYLGRWDLTLKTPQHEYPSWLEITQEDGQLKARMVSRWGHARPLPKVELSNGTITFVSPKEEEDRKDDMVFEGKLSGKMLVGTTTGPDGTAWQWTGEKAPSLKRKSEPKWGTPVQLFNGKDLSGWRTSEPASTPSWRVENGTLISPGHGPELISSAKFEDLKLHVEFNCAPGSNSGVYLRGRYELQIEDDPEPEGPTMRTGGIYGFLAPSPEQPRKPGAWQTYDITLVGRVVTVVQNGQTIIDKQEIPGITGGALDSHEALPGPIYLQGSEAGHVAFRNIMLTPGK
jgi:3-keto-disaccharide hydrolase